MTLVAPSKSSSDYLLPLVWIGAVLCSVAFSLRSAFKIRIQSIEEFGMIIHDLDPYFNWRATQYLYDNGSAKFFKWFDHMSWYPLGRPVGTTIYPGMQFTAVFIKNHIIGDAMSLNDICCYMPAWFGVIASVVVGFMAYEASLDSNSMTLSSVILNALKGKYTDEARVKSVEKHIGYYRIPTMFGLESPAIESAVFAIGFMSIVPSHLLRSVGGLYDNESIAMTAMCLTFYFWMRSLRSGEKYSYIIGILTGIAYFYMVATWGGYIFVLNLIGTHAALLVLLGRFSNKVYLAYSSFYIVGTLLAIQVPVVGWTPLKSLEQLGPCAVFLGYQILQYCEVLKTKHNWSRGEAWKFRAKFGIIALIGIAMVVVAVVPKGYFGPISSRVRGLFVPHTKTGNPLVDSVAEHFVTPTSAYREYLHILCILAPVGFILTLFRLGDSSSFLPLFAAAAYYFSRRMTRFIILTAPIASALAGVVCGHLVARSLSALTCKYETDDVVTIKQTKSNGKSKAGKKRSDATSCRSPTGITAIQCRIQTASKTKEGKTAIGITAIFILGGICYMGKVFYTECWRISVPRGGISAPLILSKNRARHPDGYDLDVIVDDYREACFWLRDKTPVDSRVLAWWDFGYQITSLANRTTTADGNTWNHEHIALVGKALTSKEEEGYQIAKHLADYIYIRIDGGAGNDLEKSPHYARIANSVYRDHCPGDPACHDFGVDPTTKKPYPMMENSLIYKLYYHGLMPGVSVSEDRFKEVFRGHYGKVRIFMINSSKESKEWVAQNRECDAGGWFCPGKYPPALKHILDKKRDFAQLEDFNRGTRSDEEYQKEYFENLNNPELARKKAELQRQKKANPDEAVGPKIEQTKPKVESKPKTKEQQKIYNTWKDTKDTARMWNLISNNEIKKLKRWLKSKPEAAWIRSGDGRGPMWWAFESKNQDVVAILKELGVPNSDQDKNGITPKDLLKL